MPKQKSLYTVRQATEMAYNSMPPVFQSQALVQMARSIMARPGCMDGSILRRLREMREENPLQFNYETIDNDRSIYRKKEYKTPVLKAAGAVQQTML